VSGATGALGSPAIRRRELGAYLRALRLTPGLTVEQVVAELLCSPSEAVLHRTVGGAIAMQAQLNHLIGFLYLERPQDIARYEQVFDRLLAMAVSPQDSIELIAKLGMEYQHVSTNAVKGPHAN
jgi:Domain of unknown function (DUF5753)